MQKATYQPNLYKPYWKILALGRFCMDLAVLSRAAMTLGQHSPVQPSHLVQGYFFTVVITAMCRAVNIPVLKANFL